MRYTVAAIFSLVAILAIPSIGLAQNSQDAIRAPSPAKTPAARVAQSHKDLAKGARAKTHATERNDATNNDGTNDGQPKDTGHIITLEQEKAIPYRACINARGWKNGRLICADDGDTVQLQKGREIEGPFSPQ